MNESGVADGREDDADATSHRIGILIVAYNAANTLVEVLDRIPRDFRSRVAGILVSDDASADATFEIGRTYAAENLDVPVTVVRQTKNLGYGGNQKFGYRWAMENDLDVVVLLHGDGQYAPEMIAEIVQPIEDGDADAVMGSRMMIPGAARRGRMPLYKFLGNRILTWIENLLAGTDLSEWHSGYRAYRVDTLRGIPFERNSDGFDFDTEIILQHLESGARIREIPIPTYYGDEISHVNGIKYAFDILRHVMRYRLHRAGFGSGELAFSTNSYEEKVDAGSSHTAISEMLSGPPCDVLDVGCGPGHLAQRLRDQGHRVVGIDIVEAPGIRSMTDSFIRADLNDGIPADVGRFDVVIAADVLEHLPDPARLLRDARRHLEDDGRFIASVPNFGHWYPRLRVAFGRFGYDRRGILDHTHLRFFTKSSFKQLARETGFIIEAIESTGLPFDAARRTATSERTSSVPDRRDSILVDCARVVDRWMTRLWPSMFSFQFIFRLRPDESRVRPPGSEW
jgi:glycosyltransferase involved in cell wall biosynthesis/2-polyprenyl-3-methyl-5-hydroxy-6-metoxy-1,4-benzoquinol methylase